jgi:hypothetical protein
MKSIEGLLAKEEPLIAFIVVSCAIDWLAGFWWGRTTRRAVKQAYTGFVETYFPPGKYEAEALYDSLRNGLVHLFAIKNRKYALVHDKPEWHLRKTSDGRQVVLNVEDFVGDWVAAKDKFFDAVERDPVLLDKALDRYDRDGFLGFVPIEVPE